MMQRIHDFMDLPGNIMLRECGTQEYEADVVILERHGEHAALRRLPGTETVFVKTLCLHQE